MKKPLKTVKKVVVGLIGFPLLVFGIILIPLPGPGLIVSFLALLLLSTEFNGFNRYLDKARAEVRRIYRAAKARADKFESTNDGKTKR